MQDGLQEFEYISLNKTVSLILIDNLKFANATCDASFQESPHFLMNNDGCSDWITLNVGGKTFCTAKYEIQSILCMRYLSTHFQHCHYLPRSTLVAVEPESMLAKMFNDDRELMSLLYCVDYEGLKLHRLCRLICGSDQCRLVCS